MVIPPANALGEGEYVDVNLPLQQDVVKLLQYHLGKLVDVSVETFRP